MAYDEFRDQDELTTYLIDNSSGLRVMNEDDFKIISKLFHVQDSLETLDEVNDVNSGLVATSLQVADDDEESIMRALSKGNGDIYGF